MTIGSRHFVTSNPSDDASSDPGDPLDLANWHPIRSKDPDGSASVLLRAAFQVTEGPLAEKGKGARSIDSPSPMLRRLSCSITEALASGAVPWSKANRSFEPMMSRTLSVRQKQNVTKCTDPVVTLF